MNSEKSLWERALKKLGIGAEPSEKVLNDLLSGGLQHIATTGNFSRSRRQDLEDDPPSDGESFQIEGSPQTPDEWHKSLCLKGDKALEELRLMGQGGKGKGRWQGYDHYIAYVKRDARLHMGESRRH